MRRPKARWAGTLITGALVALPLTRAQDSSRSASPPATKTVAPKPAPMPASGARTARDLAKLPPLQQQMYLSAQRGADWLQRSNRADGRFVYGHIPALRAPLEGDNYLCQVGAAFALARAARFFGDEHYTALARQAVLTLLLDTATDDADPQLRWTTLPAILVNRLGAAGLLVAAINELPAPGEDLLEQSEQLCNFIRKQQGADGSLNYAEAEKKAAADPQGVNAYPGAALSGLMLSQRHRPAAWKTDVVRKALPYYRTSWRAHKAMTLIPWQTAAYAEAYLATKEQAFADFVNEMNDWLCSLQYVQLDARHPLWVGGFMDWDGDKPVTSAPQVGSAVYAEGLASACRVVRQAGDPTRYQRYLDALERCLQFLSTLQYTDANTQHFAGWYRDALLGAFFASHQDGNLRLDYTQHALCALVHYLTCVIDSEKGTVPLSSKGQSPFPE